LLALFAQLHHQVRHEIADLDDVGLNWSPAPGANSIATVITHLVGSEAETLRSVAAVPQHRDREAEFTGGRRSAEELLRDLREADRLIGELAGRLGGPQLRARLALPTLPAEERRSGLTWLVGNYGHAREHVGHIQVTRQLYETQLSQLRHLDPELHPGPFVFLCVEHLPEQLDPVAVVTEDEGTTAVVRQAEADRRALPYDFVAAMITLRVQSKLEAVGLTAAVASVLAGAGIACNVMAGFFHDHLFVPVGRADEAMSLLRAAGAR
jgi:hypothetical protein